MALSIKNDDADRLARELTALTGESLTEAVIVSLRERLERRRVQSGARSPRETAMEIGRRFAARPRLDRQAPPAGRPPGEPRTPDEILGYDDRGLPT